MKLKKMLKLSERLKYVRACYGFSQAELAEKAGTTQQAIQQAEKGKARQPRYLHHLAQELEISIDWMIFGTVVQDDVVTTKGIKGLEEKSSDVADTFFAMPEKDQKLIYELMKSRQEK